ncbi:hypothetical protein [Anabaena lutea]|uniref:Uncharacterized protein n=1 Tax=Anabaena lutea FACHB-196 TaxID=2692881 RepID=A0ABR8FLK4_9NOST|nr:hypothetical protein [Anabaena lutea]MBD2570052.1 hypothetical protein [Anabaena lutea FACHB-196]
MSESGCPGFKDLQDYMGRGLMKFKRNQKGINDLKAKFRDAFGATMGVLDIEYDDVIESDTAFADLGFIGQDIVDTQRFLKSKTLITGQDFAKWEWNPKSPLNGYPYAAALYTGFYAFGKYPVAGRPWTDRAIERVNIPEWMAHELRKMGIKARSESL